MHSNPRTLAWSYWCLAFASLAAVLLMRRIIPAEPADALRVITCIHVTTAIATLVGCLTVFVCNIAYIWQRSPVWDELAAAAAQMTALSCTIVLLTGMVSAQRAWGQWWIWSPLLTFSLVLWLLYAGYVALRHVLRRSPRRGIICAMYGVVAFIDVPLFYLSAKLLPDRHPSQMHLTPWALATLLAWFVPTMMIGAGLVFVSYRRGWALRGVPGAAGPDVS